MFKTMTYIVENEKISHVAGGGLRSHEAHIWVAAISLNSLLMKTM